MKTYTPGHITDPILRREMNAIVQAANRADEYTQGVYLTAEPSRPQAGMLVLADGVSWDPGSGEGMYRRNAANSSWVFIG